MPSIKRYAAFLRGVSPMNMKMPELKRCLETAGFGDVKTLLSSGNVVFSTRTPPPASVARKVEATLERKIEAALTRDLGQPFATFVRSIDALQGLLAADPYKAFRLAPDSKRVVTFLRAETKLSLELPIEYYGARILCAQALEAFSAYIPGPRGPAFMSLIEKTFGKEVTTRTWETVTKAASAR